VPDLESAAGYFKNRQEVWFALGQAQEAAGLREQATASYIEAATVPAQQNSAPREALDRLFAREGAEGSPKLEQMLLARIMGRRAQASAEYTPTPINRPLPDFRLTTLAGRDVSARKLRGRPAIVNVWATWCPGCLVELPWLDELQKMHGDVTVLAIAWRSKPEDVRRIAEMKKLSVLRVAVSDALERDLRDSGVPTTLVIDRKGRIRFAHNDLPDVVAVLEKDLAYLAAEK
jgi:cytochrome c biogenesis protein CcmG/thiol:disulfide interchange protein DsbE